MYIPRYIWTYIHPGVSIFIIHAQEILVSRRAVRAHVHCGVIFSTMYDTLELWTLDLYGLVQNLISDRGVGWALSSDPF